MVPQNKNWERLDADEVGALDIPTDYIGMKCFYKQKEIGFLGNACIYAYTAYIENT